MTATLAEAQGRFGADDEAACWPSTPRPLAGYLFPLLQAHATLTFGTNMRLGQMMRVAQRDRTQPWPAWR